MAPADIQAMVTAPDRRFSQALKTNENHQKRSAGPVPGDASEGGSFSEEKMYLCAGRCGEKPHSKRECGSGRFPGRGQQAALAGPVDKRKELSREPVQDRPRLTRN